MAARSKSIRNKLRPTVSQIAYHKESKEIMPGGEELLRAMFEAMEEGMVYIAPDGQIVIANPAAERILGLEHSEIKARNYTAPEWQILRPDGTPMPPEEMAGPRAMNEKRPVRNMVMGTKRPDGFISWINVSAIPILDAASRLQGVLGIFTDITEKKQAEEEFRNSEKKLKLYLENSPIGMYSIDRSGTFLYGNKAAEKMTGYSREELIGKSFLELNILAPEYLPKAAQLLVQNTAGRPTGPDELELIRKDGSLISVEISTYPAGEEDEIEIISIARDITERKQAEETLRKSEENYRTLFESTFEGIIVIDAGTLKTIFGNHRAARMFGFDPMLHDGFGLDILDFVHPEDKQVVIKGFAEDLYQQERRQRYEVRAKTADGRDIWVSGIATRIEYQGRLAVLISFGDITERKQAEEALRESEEKYRAILEGIEDGYYEIDIAGNFTFFNDPMCGIIGYSKDEMIGMNNRQYMDKENTKKVYQAFNRVYATGKHTRGFGWEIIRKDGTKRFVEASVSLKRNPEGEPTGFRGMVSDVTERKQVDDELRESEDRLRALIENAPEAIISYDLSGTILDTNKKAEELISYPREEFIGKNMFELGVIPDDYAPRTIKALAKADEGVETLPFEFKLIRKDGSQITVEATTMAVERRGKLEILCIARDITERQRMEESLRLKEDAIEYSLGAIAMSDMEGKITYVNKACMRLWGSDNKEDIVGKPYGELLEFTGVVPEKPIKRMQEIKGTVLEDHSWNGELAGINKEGKKIHLYVMASIVKDNDDNPIQTISSFYDVTEQKKAEEEKERMEQQLQLAGRLAAVGELSAGIAHELNNPLAAVQAFAQFLSERKDLDESTKSDVETIYKESQRATRITTNLLSFARKHKPEKGLISINEALEKSLELYAYRMGVSNIEISMELDQELPRTMADFHQLEQVFVNIITNAEQVMTEAHGGGKLLVKTQMVGELIQITFTDDGPGITEENLKKIFDPFFTTKDVGKGTGLGLSICFGIVHEHGGRLYARSKSGEGATFVAEIPIVFEDKPIAQESH